MSLYIVGSCSKITQNIVLQLAKNNQYKKITIGDMLPVYQFHSRFYQLQKDLA
jgi:predicted PP-loop superfamily ATPase